MNKKLFTIQILNTISTISQEIGLEMNKINQLIKYLKINIIDKDKIYYLDTIKIFQYYKINYIVSDICTIKQQIENRSLLNNNYNKKLSIGIIGHVNHGKTTMISEMTGAKILEAHDITQNISIYEKENIYIIDTPGHEIFNHIREHILSVIDFIVLTISLHDGIEFETEKILNLIHKRNLHNKTLVVFTKYDIKKYEVKDIVKQIECEYNFKGFSYITKSFQENKLKEIINIVTEIQQLYEEKDLHKHDGIIINKENINGTEYCLIKLNKNSINKKTTLLFDNKIAKINKILSLNKKQITNIEGQVFCYVNLSISIPIQQNSTFLCSSCDKEIDKYNKYITYTNYIVNINENKNIDTNKVVENYNKVFFFVKDEITQEIIYNTLKNYTIFNRSKVFYNINMSLAMCVSKNDEVIVFNKTLDTNIYNTLKKITTITVFDKIYDLIDYLEINNKKILDNIKIKNLAVIIKIFEIKGTYIYGCNILRGQFEMNSKVLATVQKDEFDNFVIQNAITTSIVSIKKGKSFVKITKKNDQIGFIFYNLANKLPLNGYIFTM
ncbi:Translation initiation factor IF-2 [bacterium AB1]|nr:Translation initiation factor IF-2 [bacterium AB1]